MILIPIAPGELLDRISILDIKLARITDAAKRANVAHEHAVLSEARAGGIPASAECDALFELLSAVNLKLWNVEDALRDHERDARFDVGFIALARSVYVLNDERAALKKAINLLLGSDIVEEKSYASYAPAASTSS